MMKGITKRWIKNSIGMTMFLITCVIIVAAIAVRTFYYNNIQSLLEKRVLVTHAVLRPSDTEGYYSFDARSRAVMENYQDAHAIEMLMLNETGKAFITSSGITLNETDSPEDYIRAGENENGIGLWIGDLPATSERVMAVTAIVYNDDHQHKQIGAVRMMVSLSRVDLQITIFIFMMIAAGLIFLFISVSSGTYFINSIVIPVNEIADTTKKIARGDYNIRIDKHYDDEIGDLCDTINELVGELVMAEKAKNDFISTISHELRTPLTAIKGWGETLMTATDDPALMQKGMGVVITETNRLSQMVEELLDFSRLQSGRLTMHMTKTDVIAELEEAVLMFSQRALQENKKLELVEPETPILPIIADNTRIKQVFINVIDNAIKYTETGGEIMIRTVQGDNNVQVIVSDNGVGISESDLSRIKEKFYKANFTRRGSGIGLAVCEEIIRQHSGIFGVDSIEGQGTTITIALPIEQKGFEYMTLH